MTDYSKRDPGNVPPYANSHLYKTVFGDGKAFVPPANALANATWGIFGPQLLEAVKLTYRKHHLGDDTIGWEELSDTLLNVLCETMGDAEFMKWIDEVTP